MALTRRGLGLGLLATGIGGTAGVAWLGPERIGRLVTGNGPDPVTLWGFVGGEKVDFLRSPRVRDLLSRRYGLTLDARRAGSIEMVSDPALTAQHPQWLWPANSVMTQMARANGMSVRRDEIVFNSPLVLYSWTPVVAALEKAGYVERQDGIHTVRMAALMDAVVRGLAWRDLGVPELYGRVVVTTTDPARSNSGFSFAALLANLFAGDVATPDSLARDGERLRTVFARMGYNLGARGSRSTRCSLAAYEERIQPRRAALVACRRNAHEAQDG